MANALREIEDITLHRTPAIALIVGLTAFAYYSLLSAREWTWVFLSGDSGGWLWASNVWAVTQPYGAPLYILLGHLLNIFPGDPAPKMTILLSALPSAVTVALVYMIVNKLTSNTKAAVVSSLVLLGSAVFLTQSTVLEIYALPTTLLTLSFWYYLNDKRHLTALCWGLAAAIHVFVLGAVFLWLIVEWRHYIKPLLTVTVPVTAAFYGFILLLMYLDTPRLVAGGLNLYSLHQYLFVTAGAIVGQLSIFEAPERLLLTARLLLMSFGLALIPLITNFRVTNKPTAVLLGIIMWTLWYQVTCLDVSAWTFLTFASPSVAILVGTQLSKAHLKAVAAGALIFVLANGVFLNANTLTSKNPLATTYRDSLMNLPDGSIVLTEAGARSLGLFYVISEGKNLIPLVYPYLDAWNFKDYKTWLQNNHDIEVRGSTLETVNANPNVYVAYEPRGISQELTLEDTNHPMIRRVRQ